MDDDLKQYLDGMHANLVGRIDRAAETVRMDLVGRIDRAAETVRMDLVGRIDRAAETMRMDLVGRIDRAAEATATEVGSLHTQIQQVETHLGARLDSIDSRLKLQGGLIQSGARAMARFSEFAENSEERWVALVGRVEALERKIEGGAGKV